MVTFEQLAQKWRYRPIPNCPGRYVLGCPAALAPEVVLGDGTPVREFRTAAARDPVWVARLPNGGLISYRHPDGTFTHTLNDDVGFRRKLDQLGIDW
jgi:hypothetical protein